VDARKVTWASVRTSAQTGGGNATVWHDEEDRFGYREENREQGSNESGLENMNSKKTATRIKLGGFSMCSSKKITQMKKHGCMGGWMMKTDSRKTMGWLWVIKQVVIVESSLWSSLVGGPSVYPRQHLWYALTTMIA